MGLFSLSLFFYSLFLGGSRGDGGRSGKRARRTLLAPPLAYCGGTVRPDLEMLQVRTSPDHAGSRAAQADLRPAVVVAEARDDDGDEKGDHGEPRETRHGGGRTGGALDPRSSPGRQPRVPRLLAAGR